MLDVYAVVKEKEVAIAQLRREVEALRLVCQMLQDEDESVPNVIDSGPEPGEEAEPGGEITAVSPVSEREAILASIRIRLMDARQNDPTKESRSVVLQFRQAALGASRALWKVIPRNRLFETKPQVKSIRNLFERFGRHAA